MDFLNEPLFPTQKSAIFKMNSNLFPLLIEHSIHFHLGFSLFYTADLSFIFPNKQTF